MAFLDKLAGSVAASDAFFPFRDAVDMLAAAGVRYHGWLANIDVPGAFSRALATIHVPRRYYADMLPGIPTIRVFEALACGIPLICAQWDDTEHLFTPGQDYLVARDGAEMADHLRTLVHEPERARALAGHGRRTVLARHTCAHRVDELLTICRELGVETAAHAAAPA